MTEESEASAVVVLYVYSEFTPEDGCNGGDGYAILYLGKKDPECSNFRSDIECEVRISPFQILLINMISNRSYSCCSGFNRFKLLVVDENTTDEIKEEFEKNNEYYIEERNEYSYLKLLELLGDKETVKID
jgi:hypothetical protein